MSRLVIFHTNDIHSHFERLPMLAAGLKERRRHYAGLPQLTLDGGDHMDRCRLETEGSGGLVNIELLNHLQYDAVVPGNNEGLTFTYEQLARLYSKHAQFTVLGGNMRRKASGRLPEWMSRYLVTVLDGMRVGIIGVTIDFNDFYRELGWELEDPIAELQTVIPVLRKQVDVLLVMSHLGLAHDRRIAEMIEGIDVLFGSHTHHLLEHPEKYGHTYLCATGCFGRYLGETVLDIDPETKKVVRVEGRCLEAVHFTPDSETERIISKYESEAKLALGETVSVLERELKHDNAKESALGNLLASGLRKRLGAEVGLVNAGQLLDGIPKGKVTLEKLLAICPSPINPCRMQLKGVHIRHALEQSITSEFIEKPLRGFGFRGKTLGTLCVDGITVFVDSSHATAKISSVIINGKPLEDEREYSVGTIDMFTFGVGYPTISQGEQIHYDLPDFIRDILAVQLADSAAIRESHVPRWIEC